MLATRLSTGATEQPALGLLDQLELCILGVDAQLVQRQILGLVDGLTCCLYPFHCVFTVPSVFGDLGASRRSGER